LESFGLVIGQVDPRQPGNVRDIEIRSSGHVRRSRMQMANEPHDRKR
jgi:hypothetical protein